MLRSASTSSKSFFAVIAMVIALTGAGWAVDFRQMADDASEKVDQALQDTAEDFNQEFKKNMDSVNRQYNESQGMQNPSSQDRLPQLNRNLQQGDLNMSGNPALNPVDPAGSSIQDRFGPLTDQANQELGAAGKRDDYTMNRRELETTRNLTFPGTPEYEQLTEQMNRLDQNFAESQR